MNAADRCLKNGWKKRTILRVTYNEMGNIKTKYFMITGIGYKDVFVMETNDASLILNKATPELRLSELFDSPDYTSWRRVNLK